MKREIEYIDLGELQNSPDMILMAKIDIEHNIVQENKSKLVDFMSSLNINNVYTYKKQMVTFSIKEGNQYDYVFYMQLKNAIRNEDIDKLEKETLDNFKAKLEKINYDLSNLTKKTNYEIIETGNDILEYGEYFIINNSFYI